MVRVVSCSPVRRAILATSTLVLTALAVLAGSTTAPAAAPAVTGRAALPPDAPLVVTIEDLRPSYIPRRGPVRISGSVTNVDTVTWSTVNLYAFVGGAPITTSLDLAAAVETDPTEPVGERILTAGTSDAIPELAPGESEQFRLVVPRREILETILAQQAAEVDEPGVYWFGVHALGQGPQGRDEIADGRARTFLPLVPASTPGTVKTALVIPLRRAITANADGSLESPAAWTRTLSGNGRLRSLVDFGASAGSRPVSWLVDPALPDAAARLSRGNPARSLAPTTPEPGAEPTETPTEGPSETAEPEPAAPPPDPATVAAGTAAAAWLARLEEAIGDNEVLALPYGDLDVAAAGVHDPALYPRARARSGPVLRPLGIETVPAVGSPTGYLDAQGLAMVEPEATVLVTDRMFDARGSGPPGVVTVDGHDLVVTSSGAASGGPAPGDALTAVALRQRILSEAAIRLLNPGRKPLVTLLPQDWTPESYSGFFSGFDVDWVSLVSVSNAADRQGRRVGAEDLLYPTRQSTRELDADSFEAASSLRRGGESLENLLSRNDTVGAEVGDQALTSTSYAVRAGPAASLASVERSQGWIDDVLGSVEIDAPRGVTLASESGNFSATVSNNLAQPVTVSIQALTDDRMEIRPIGPIEIAPESRTTVLLNARTTQLGVHNVTLLLTDSEGTPLGSSDELPIRSGQVSDLIWAIMGTGAALLFTAIAVRLVRRVRRARAELRRSGPEPGPEPA